MDDRTGESLATAIANAGGGLEPTRVVRLFLQVADAMAHAHGRGVVHRDLKPSNILISRNDQGSDHIKVVDFGIAKVLNEQADNQQNLTQTGEILGSPLYMSPEQCLGNSLDGRSDVYSLGCVMYEALTGNPPLSGDNTVQTILKHVNVLPKPMREMLPALKLPAGLEELVWRCLQKEPADRYQSVELLRQDLMAVQEGRPLAKVVSQSAGVKAAGAKTSGGNAAGADCENKSDVGVAGLNFSAGKKERLIAVTGFGLLAFFMATAFSLNMHHEGPKPPAIDAAGLGAKEGQSSRPDSYEGRTLTQWTNAIEADPTNPHWYFGRAMLHGSRDERTNAIEDFSKTIELDPNFFEAYLRRASEYTLTNQFKEALADADTAIKRWPNKAESYMARAFAEKGEENNQAAVADFEKSNKIYSDQMQKLKEQTSKFPDGAAETLAYISNEIAYNCYIESSALLNMGQAERALAVNTRAIDLTSTDRRAMYHGQRAIIYGYLQEFDKALADALIATRQSDARGVEWAALAYSYVGLGEIDNAEQSLDHAFTLETFPARGYRLKAEVYRTAGLLEKAIQAYSASTSLEAYAPGYRGRAIAYIAQGQYHSAEEDLIKADKIVGGNPLTLSFLARVQDHNGKPAVADKTLAAAFAQDAKMPITLVNRAAIYFHRGQLPAALADLNAALSIDKDLKEAYALRSDLYEKMGDTKLSLKDREQASHLVPHIEY